MSRLTRLLLAAAIAAIATGAQAEGGDAGGAGSDSGGSSGGDNSMSRWGGESYLAFERDRIGQREAKVAERMAAAGIGITPQQRVVAGIEEHQFRIQA